MSTEQLQSSIIKSNFQDYLEPIDLLPNSSITPNLSALLNVGFITNFLKSSDFIKASSKNLIFFSMSSKIFSSRLISNKDNAYRPAASEKW